jgi:hypothetical protein
MTTLYQSAVDNYPEDEAHASAQYALDLFETDGADALHQWIIKERSAVIHNLFDDDETLIARFTKKFNELTAPVTNLYF